MRRCLLLICFEFGESHGHYKTRARSCVCVRFHRTIKNRTECLQYFGVFSGARARVCVSVSHMRTRPNVIVGQFLPRRKCRKNE